MTVNNKILGLGFIAFVLSPGVSVYGQSVQKDKNDTLTMIAHKWQITQLERQGKKMNMPAGKGGLMQVNSNGVLMVSDDSKTSYRQTWTYDNKSRTIHTDENLVVLKIDNQNLVLHSNADNIEMNVYLKRLN